MREYQYRHTGSKGRIIITVKAENIKTADKILAVLVKYRELQYMELIESPLPKENL